MNDKICFTKMHGSGNDYIYVDITNNFLKNPGLCAKVWSCRHTGIGADGLVLVGKSDIADFSMRIFNADGTEAMMCGNACRCVGKYVFDKGMTDKHVVTLETLSGVKSLKLHVADGVVDCVTVDMGTPVFSDDKFVATKDGSLSGAVFDVCGYQFECVFVSMGNPHLVVFVDDVASVPLETVGPVLENHELFPQRVNVEFVECVSGCVIRVRVWERGSGVTQACGTGACACAVAAIRNKKLSCDCMNVVMDGGNVEVVWNRVENKLYMTGPAVTVYEGEMSGSSMLEHVGGKATCV